MAQPISKRECIECGGELPEGAHARARTCSDECRRVRKNRVNMENKERRRAGTYRKCEKCGGDIPRTPGPNKWCEDCRPEMRRLTNAENTRQWIAENRDRYNSGRAEWRRTDKGKAAVARWGTARRLNLYTGVRSPWSRDEIIDRDGYSCYLCGEPIVSSDFQIDHVRPLALGGDDAPWNVAATHWLCNTRKSDSFNEVSQDMERKLLAEVKS